MRFLRLPTSMSSIDFTSHILLQWRANTMPLIPQCWQEPLYRYLLRFALIKQLQVESETDRRIKDAVVAYMVAEKMLADKIQERNAKSQPISI